MTAKRPAGRKRTAPGSRGAAVSGGSSFTPPPPGSYVWTDYDEVLTALDRATAAGANRDLTNWLRQIATAVAEAYPRLLMSANRELLRLEKVRGPANERARLWRGQLDETYFWMHTEVFPKIKAIAEDIGKGPVGFGGAAVTGISLAAHALLRYSAIDPAIIVSGIDDERRASARRDGMAKARSKRKSNAEARAWHSRIAAHFGLSGKSAREIRQTLIHNSGVRAAALWRGATDHDVPSIRQIQRAMKETRDT